VNGIHKIVNGIHNCESVRHTTIKIELLPETTKCELKLDPKASIEYPGDDPRIKEILKWKDPTPKPKPVGILIRDAALAPKPPSPIVISSDEDFDPSQIPPKKEEEEPNVDLSSSGSDEEYQPRGPIKLEAIDDVALLKAMGIRPTPEEIEELREMG